MESSIEIKRSRKYRTIALIVSVTIHLIILFYLIGQKDQAVSENEIVLIAESIK